MTPAIQATHSLLPTIREAFKAHARDLPRPPIDRDLVDLAYLTELARNAPTEITHGDAHKGLRKGVRELLASLPGLIEAAELEAKAAIRDGRATDMDTFARHARTLLEAAEPFRETGEKRRDRRSSWHGWARVMATEIRLIFGRCGAPNVPFSHNNAPAILIVQKLLSAAGWTVEPHSIVDVLHDPADARGI